MKLQRVGGGGNQPRPAAPGGAPGSGLEPLGKGLEKLISDIREKWGDRAIIKASQLPPITFVSTGLKGLDRALGGGFPVGRISEVYGPESAGKSTLVLRVIAEVQKDPKARCCYMDLENTMDVSWAEKLGVDMDRLLLVRAVPAEDAGDLLVKLVREQWELVVIDSIVEMLPGEELEKGVGDQSYAPVARVMARMLPKVVVLQSSSPTTVVVINQIRDKIGVFKAMMSEISKRRAPGGHALAHMDSIKLWVQRKEPIYDKKEKVGYVMATRVVKSKVGREGLESRQNVLWGRGIFDLDSEAREAEGGEDE